MKKALLIGIDYLNTDNQLNGCINDIVNMSNMLIDAYDYNKNDIIMLRDDYSNNTLIPSRNNILNNLNYLVSQSNNLTELWIHYSGHGSQIKDFNGDENGGMDSIIVPCDYAMSGVIVDDELLNIIRNVKCKTILIFDSCNSGTICDMPFYIEYKTPTVYAMKQISNFKIVNPNIFVFSGCKDTQYSSDVFNSDTQQSNGAFTNAFIESLRKNKHNVTIMMLYRDICLRLFNNGFTQSPVLSCSSYQLSYSFIRAMPTTSSQSATIASTNTTSLVKKIMKSIIQL